MLGFSQAEQCAQTVCGYVNIQQVHWPGKKSLHLLFLGLSESLYIKMLLCRYFIRGIYGPKIIAHSFKLAIIFYTGR